MLLCTNFIGLIKCPRVYEKISLKFFDWFLNDFFYVSLTLTIFLKCNCVEILKNGMARHDQAKQQRFAVRNVLRFVESKNYFLLLFDFYPKIMQREAHQAPFNITTHAAKRRLEEPYAVLEN